MAPDPREVRAVLTAASRAEREWTGKIAAAGSDPGLAPWIPFPIPAFLALLLEALPVVPGGRFLEIGAGCGTKMLLAREICGLDVTGIEINPVYAAGAAALGLDVRVEDAADFRDYDRYDLIWFNPAFRDTDAEASLEKLIWSEVRPGAVVMCANLWAPPPGWIVILDDWELRRGIWMKPLAGES